jgi:hypothetical protein
MSGFLQFAAFEANAFGSPSPLKRTGTPIPSPIWKYFFAVAYFSPR